MFKIGEPIASNLKKINGGQTPAFRRLNGLARFLLELGAQHVEAYISGEQNGFKLPATTLFEFRNAGMISNGNGVNISTEPVLLKGAIYVLNQLIGAVVNSCYNTNE